ncbi:hypothetical protein ACJX0J_017762 [Zea mays]
MRVPLLPIQMIHTAMQKTSMKKCCGQMKMANHHSAFLNYCYSSDLPIICIMMDATTPWIHNDQPNAYTLREAVIKKLLDYIIWPVSVLKHLDVNPLAGFFAVSVEWEEYGSSFIFFLPHLWAFSVAPHVHAFPFIYFSIFPNLFSMRSPQKQENLINFNKVTFNNFGIKVGVYLLNNMMSEEQFVYLLFQPNIITIDGSRNVWYVALDLEKNARHIIEKNLAAKGKKC